MCVNDVMITSLPIIIRNSPSYSELVFIMTRTLCYRADVTSVMT